MYMTIQQKMTKITKAYSNDRLLQALKERDEVIQSIVSEDSEYDDRQLIMIQKYVKLPQFYKDLLYLTTRYKIKDICELYGVSHTHIYKNLKIIKELLK